MVESLGSAAIRAGDARIASVQRAQAAAPTAEVQAPAKAKAPAEAAAPPPATMASSMAEKPPVDASRVQQIKTALANGTFPLSPSTIADQFIALKYDWMSRNEPA